MHIADGVLSVPVIVATSSMALVGVGIGLSKLSHDDVPRVGVMAAVFFVTSLIHINIGPVSVHLMLTGLMGLLLSWASFPALAVALLLQTLFFGYGGITTLGANTLSASISGIICYYLFSPFVRGEQRKAGYYLVIGCMVGACGIILNCFFLSVIIYFSDKDFLETLLAISVAHIPVALIEAFVVGTVLSFFNKVKPELLSKGLFG
jgi:cobalt/nickel transport system permease protein